MQLTTLTAGLAAAILATTGAAQITDYNKNGTGNVPNRARVVNNCPYNVYLWSILKGQGCPPEAGVMLSAKGGFYHEAFRQDGKTGVSLKISKSKKCDGDDITQLEYFEERADKAYAFNYLDVSYVNCGSGDCPGRNDGYALKSGNVGKTMAADASNPLCPTFECTDKASCDKTSYVLPHDVQTKSCGLGEPLDFYLCGKSPSGGSYEEEDPVSSAAPASSAAPVSSAQEEEPTPIASSTPIYQEAKVNAAEAQVTSAPAEQPKQPLHVKTETVYVTQVVKRHAHNHVHRHFRA